MRFMVMVFKVTDRKGMQLINVEISDALQIMRERHSSAAHALQRKIKGRIGLFPSEIAPANILRRRGLTAR